MANTYNVGDSVTVQIDSSGNIIEPSSGTENLYKATVITFSEDDNGDYIYRLSVDGLGDTVLAKESE